MTLMNCIRAALGRQHSWVVPFQGPVHPAVLLQPGWWVMVHLNLVRNNAQLAFWAVKRLVVGTPVFLWSIQTADGCSAASNQCSHSLRTSSSQSSSSGGDKEQAKKSDGRTLPLNCCWKRQRWNVHWGTKNPLEQFVCQKQSYLLKSLMNWQ